MKRVPGFVAVRPVRRLEVGLFSRDVRESIDSAEGLVSAGRGLQCPFGLRSHGRLKHGVGRNQPVLSVLGRPRFRLDIEGEGDLRRPTAEPRIDEEPSTTEIEDRRLVRQPSRCCSPLAEVDSGKDRMRAQPEPTEHGADECRVFVAVAAAACVQQLRRQ